MAGDVVEIKTSTSIDHWAFLDEFDAPMWADLNVEASLTNQEIDDEWFHISHQFHQCSSRQLISKVFHSDEGVPFSPELPASVSRSRGKIFRNKELGRSKCKITSSKLQPVKSLSDESSLANSRPRIESKCKIISSKLQPVKSLSGESSLANSRPRTELKAISLTEKLHEKDCSKTSFACESGLINTYGLKSSNEAISLLTALRASLRKSCGTRTRQASRVKVNGGRQSEGRNSTSSKSSAGSSSFSLSGYGGKSCTLGETPKKDKTPDSRVVCKVSLETRNKLKVPNGVSKKPSVRVLRDISSNTRRENETLAYKAKAQPNASCTKVLVPSKFSGSITQKKSKFSALDQLTATKAEKMGTGQHCVFSIDNSKIATGPTVPTQKSKSIDKAALCMRHLRKVSQQAVPQRSDRRKLVSLKEQAGGRSIGKESTNLVQKVHFR